jgi:hypothetical protein
MHSKFERKIRQGEILAYKIVNGKLCLGFKIKKSRLGQSNNTHFLIISYSVNCACFGWGEHHRAFKIQYTKAQVRVKAIILTSYKLQT